MQKATIGGLSPEQRRRVVLKFVEEAQEALGGAVHDLKFAPDLSLCWSRLDDAGRLVDKAMAKLAPLADPEKVRP